MPASTTAQWTSLMLRLIAAAMSSPRISDLRCWRAAMSTALMYSATSCADWLAFEDLPASYCLHRKRRGGNQACNYYGQAKAREIYYDYI